MHKEESYLLLKIGQEEEALKVLIRSCHDVTEIVEFALTSLRISDMQNLWDMLVSQSDGDPEQLN